MSLGFTLAPSIRLNDLELRNRKVFAGTPEPDLFEGVETCVSVHCFISSNVGR